MPGSRFTLVSDGASDRALLPLLSWVLVNNTAIRAPHGEYADLRRVQRPRSLGERIELALKWFPCDLLFVHRDAENQEPELRYQEIQKALLEIHHPRVSPVVCVVPVRMQEAWLLFDEKAIRTAASNPNGRDPLSLPDLGKIESLPDPKAVLYGLLRVASGLRKRRLKSFSEPSAAVLIGQYIRDFAPLRRLPAFQRLEENVRRLNLRPGITPAAQKSSLSGRQ